MNATVKRHFFSLKWKTLLIFGLLLVVSHCVQYLISHRHLVEQFEFQREQEQQYQLAIAKDLVHQSARLLEQSADSIQLITRNLGLSSSPNGLIISALESHWETLQANLGISSIYYYNIKTDLKGSWGEVSDSFLVKKEQLEKTVKWERPSFFLRCTDQCYQIVQIPALNKSGTGIEGVIVLVRSLADVIIAFEKTTGIDLGILKYDRTNNPENDWSFDLIAASSPDRTRSLFTQLQNHYREKDFLTGEVVTDFKDKNIGVRFFAFDENSKPEPGTPFLLLATDLTKQLQQIEQAKKQSLFSILTALAISVLLLFAVLMRQTNRLISVSDLLPALSKGHFSKVRQQFQNRHNDVSRWRRDELDLIEESLLQVADQLDQNKKEISETTSQLNSQRQKAIQEHNFINELLNTAPVVILTQSTTGEIISINHQGCSTLQMRPSQLIGNNFFELFPKSRQSDAKEKIEQVLAGERKQYRHETAIDDESSGSKTISWFHKSIITEKPEEVTTLSIGLDVTEQKEAEAHLVWMADHDPLTNLYNRRRFQVEFEKLLKVSERYQKKGALLYFDLDQFKYINDTSGHSAGDKLLKIVAEILQQDIRTSDTLARLGGDEFALLIPETDIDGAASLAEKIMETLRTVQFQSNGHVHNISVSIGIALFPEHGSNVHDFMANADLAMYQAKEAGRGRWHLFSPGDKTKEILKKRVLWKEKIETALKDELFFLHYQPILDVKSNQISHLEALVRMKGCDGETIMPGDFIPTAEHTGQIYLVDMAVIKLALETLDKLAQENNPVKLSINLSGRAFDNPQVIEFLRQELSRKDVDPSKLIFEVTETTAVANFSTAKEMMNEIKKLGAKFALDDFGVGFASFYYLRQLPVDYVKIDGSFIRQLAKHKEDRVLVQAIAEIAKISGKKTVAEFVEDQRILELLQAYGIDYAQGYHIGKPSADLNPTLPTLS